MGGINVGDGAEMGVGVVVTKGGPYAVAASLPAKLIRYRFSEDTIELQNSIRW